MKTPLAVLLIFGCVSSLTAATPNAAKSKAAIAELNQALEAKPKNLEALYQLVEQPFAQVPLTKDDAAQAKAKLWDAYVTLMKAEKTAEMAANKLVEDKLEMPFIVKTFGKKPKDGHSIWISIHGGGGAPARVNDGQWENQKKLYTLEEGLYVVPRAPTNTWNLWHEAHIDRFFGRIVRNLVALEGANPNRVYIMGYSAGGDGVYQIGPRLADHWAGAAMMAGHPNDANPFNLRNVAFALQMGGKDSAYNRNTVAQTWGDKLKELKKDDPDGYELFFKIYPDKGHWMDREDAVALPWMAKYTRNPIPKTVAWLQGSTTTQQMYWLAVPKGEAKAGSLAIAKRDGQTITFSKLENHSKLHVRLDDRMANLNEAIVVQHGKDDLLKQDVQRTAGVLLKTLAERGDPELMFSAELEVNVPAKK